MNTNQVGSDRRADRVAQTRDRRGLRSLPKKSFVYREILPEFSLWKKMWSNKSPCSFELELTSRCQNNCRHCYVNVHEADQKAISSELRLSEILDISDQAVSLGILWCLLSGGEPLLRPDFPEIYFQMIKRGLLVSVFTNAGLITDELVGLFKRFPPRRVEVSVYGESEKVYERVTRKPGSYAAFRRGLEKLINAGFKPVLKAMVMRSNAIELKQIKTFGREISGKLFRFDPILTLRSDNNLTRNREILAERLSAEEIVDIEENAPTVWNQIRKSCHPLGNFAFPEKNNFPLFLCGAGLKSFNIRASGIFNLCTSLNHPDFSYDLKNGSLSEAVKKFVPSVRETSVERKPLYAGCYNCSQANFCTICPGNMYLETGDLEGWSDYFCKIGKTRESRLVHLISNNTISIR